MKIFGRTAASVVGCYQKTLSPDHGWLRVFYPYGYCRFFPSCSEYSRQGFIEFGFWRGLFLSLRRLGRCHPWSRGGLDPIPKSKTLEGRK